MHLSLVEMMVGRAWPAAGLEVEMRRSLGEWIYLFGCVVITAVAVMLQPEARRRLGE